MRKKALSLLVSLTLALCFGTSLAYAAPSGGEGGSGIGTQATGDKYPVTFIIAGKQVAEQAIEQGQKATDPKDGIEVPEGYELNGWYVDEKIADQSQQFDFDTVIASNTTLYAEFVPVEYKITFNGNKPTDAGSSDDVELPEGEAFTSGITATYDADVTIPAGTPTLKGYQFLGWTKQGDDAIISDGSADVTVEKANFQSTKNAEQKLTAKWQKIYTVTFVSEKSESADVPKAEIIVADSENNKVAKPAGLPAVTGYTTNGEWYVGNNGTVSTEAYDFDAAVSADLTLVAKWTANTYTIKFNANKPSGATGDVTMPTDDDFTNGITATYGQDVTIKAGKPTLEGYEFLGWFTAATMSDGDEVVSDGEQAKTLTTPNYKSEQGAEQVLYAQWKINEYTVTFNYDGHGAVSANPTETVEYGANVTKPAEATTEDAKYDLVDWYTQDQFSDLAARTLEDDAKAYDFNTAVTGDLTLYAKWETKSFTVTFMSDGEVAKEDKVKYGDTATAPTGLEKTGYATDGKWYTSEATDAEEFVLSSPIQEETTLYAKWTPITYTVKFDANKPAEAAASPDMTMLTDADFTNGITATYDKDVVIPAGTPTLEGYEFLGWFTAATMGDDDKVVSDGEQAKTLTTPNYKSEQNAEQVLYAQWKINQYTVTFKTDYDSDVVDPSPAPAAQTVEYGKTANDPNETPTSKSAQSDGKWYVGTVDDETNEITLETSAFDFATEIKKDVTLYPKWEPYKYTVTFTTDYTLAGDGAFKPTNPNPSSVTTQDQLLYNAVINKPAEDPTADNALFDGWYLGTADSDSKVTLTDKFDFANAKATDNVTLYAKWNEAVKITFKNNDAEIADASRLVKKGEVPTYNGTTPTKESTDTTEYTFAGWQSGDDKYAVGTDLPAATQEATYEAYFEESVRTYTIKWMDGDGTTVLKEYTQPYNTDITPYSGKDPEKAKTAELTYKFASKWKKNSETTEIASDGAFGKVAGDTTFTPVFTETTNVYTVKYVTNDAVTAPDGDTVAYGAYVADPKLVVDASTGYAFDDKWYTDADKTKEFAFGDAYKPEEYGDGTLTLYAGLTKTEAKAAYDEAQAAADEAAADAAAKKDAADAAKKAADAAAKTAAADKAAAEEAAKTPGDAAVAAANKAAASAAAAEAAAKASEEAAAAYQTAAANAAEKAQAAADAAAAGNSGVSADDQKALSDAAAAAKTTSSDAAKAAETAAAATKTAAAAMTAAKGAQSTATTQAKAAADKAAAQPKAQPVTAKNKTVTLKASKLKKKAQTISYKKVVKGNKAKTKLTYKLVSAKKAKKNFKKYFKVAKNGKITVKKGLKKGTYKVTVKATAAKSSAYKSASKNFVVTVKVK